MIRGPSELFYLAVGLLSAVLQILLISEAGQKFRKFPVLACYAIACFLTSVMEGAIFLQAFGFSNDFSRNVYWFDEGILQTLVYLLVVSLMGKALSARSPKRGFRFDLAALALAVMAFCILVAHKHGAPYAVSFTAASRNLSFASAGLNMLLWSALLASRIRDPQLLMLSGGLGIQTTGRAIGHSLRKIPIPQLKLIGNTLMILTYVASLFILWRALSQKTSSFDRPQAKE